MEGKIESSGVHASEKIDKKTEYPPSVSHILLYRWYKEGITGVAELNEKLAQKNGNTEVFPSNVMSFCINEGAKVAGEKISPIQLTE